MPRKCGQYVFPQPNPHESMIWQSMGFLESQTAPFENAKVFRTSPSATSIPCHPVRDNRTTLEISGHQPHSLCLIWDICFNSNHIFFSLFYGYTRYCYGRCCSWFNAAELKTWLGGDPTINPTSHSCITSCFCFGHERHEYCVTLDALPMPLSFWTMHDLLCNT